MSKDTNIVVITGRLGASPELRTFQNGSHIANFNLAVGDDYRDKQGNCVERTHWITVNVFGKMAEVANQYLTKGSRITVQGKLVQEQWKDQNGNSRNTVKINAEIFQMLDSKPQGNSNNNWAQESQGKPKQQAKQKEWDGYADHERPQGNNFDDEIPF
ncbi:MAG: single-stranded DNA-binding protein [[Actinobacillus] rossii]|nr:single-stranded DNA-binding protein [[Actinobacillus] rossii]